MSDLISPEPIVRTKANTHFRACQSCGRRYMMRNDGTVAMHTGDDRVSECPGSRREPAEVQDVEEAPTGAASLPMQKATKVTGIAVHRLRRWIEGGYIKSETRREGSNSAHVIPWPELEVAVVMDRLLGGGLNDLASVAALARKHLEEVDILRAMGHTGDSIATEHTIGEGLVLTIT